MSQEKTTAPLTSLMLPKKRVINTTGLWGSAVHYTPQDPHWESGFSWMPECCGEVGCWSESCDCEGAVDEEGNPLVKKCSFAGDLENAYPYELYVYECCKNTGPASFDWVAERAVRKLEAGISGEVECALMSGDCSVDEDGEPLNPYLASPDAVIVGTEMSPAHTLFTLVQNLCNCPSGVGMIHASPYLVSAWCSLNLVETIMVDYKDWGFDQDTFGPRRILVEKVGGNIIVSGCGYGADAPPGEIGNEEDNCIAWAYATSMVCILSGQTRVHQSSMDQAMTLDDAKEVLDRRTNTICIEARKTVAALFSPCEGLYAASTNLCADGGICP